MHRDEIELLIKNGFLQSEPDETLTQNELSSLVNQGFLEELPNHFFSFHNNLTWEVIYETLLYSERRLLHNIIAIHIEKHNKENLDAVSDLLLYHYERSRNLKKCVFYGALAGDRASSMFANKDALAFYQRSLSALDQLKRDLPVDRCTIYEHIGDVHENAGAHKNALDAYYKALEFWSQSTSSRKKTVHVPWNLKPSTHEALLARKIAMSLEHNSEYDEALKWLDKAENVLPSRPGKVASQIAATRSATLYRKGELEQAISWGKSALKIAKRTKQKGDAAYAHNMIANTFIQLGSLKKAITHLEQAEKICVETEDFPGIATVSSNLGDCHYYLGDLAGATKHYNNALISDEKLHNNAGIIMGHFNLGNIYTDIGELDKSISHLNKVIEAFKENKCRRDLAAAAFMSLSKCQRLNRKLNIAESAIKESLNLLKVDDQSKIFSFANLQYAELLLEQDNPEGARNIAESVLTEAKQQKNTGLELIAERILGNSHMQLKNLEMALEHGLKSIELSKNIGAEHEEALSILAHTNNLIASNRVTNLENNNIHRAIDILTKIGAKLDLERANKLLEKVNELAEPQ